MADFEINTPDGPAIATAYGSIMLSDIFSEQDGELFWLPRRREWFLNYRQSRIWNAQHAGKRFGFNTNENYVSGRVFGRRIFAHRLVFAMNTGAWPSNRIDHKNGVKDDNRITNLRDVSDSENSKNRPLQSTNKSGVCGVRRDMKSGRWCAGISHKYKHIHLGSFATLDDATAARKAAEVRFGYHANHGRNSTPTADKE